MTSYLLLESDLQNLTTLSGGSGVCLSFGTFLGALRLDLFKDTSLAEAVPQATADGLAFVNPILGVLAVSFIVASGILWVKRGSELKRIRSESKNIG